MSNTLIVGSVAFDIIFSVHNTLKEEIVISNNEAHNISMMLTANNKLVFYGGTAGNIAYGLGLQGESPLLFSVAGDDFETDYKQHLEKLGVDCRIVVKPSEYTASFYGISDKIGDQVGIFQPNTHGDYMHKIKLTDKISNADLEKIEIACFSPGTGESIYNHMSQLRQFNSDCRIIFDPSQVLSIFFDENLLAKCLDLADIFIGNETEVDQLQKIAGRRIEDILANQLEAIIETRGADGSIIHRPGQSPVEIPARKADQFVEQTGAGDAYRAGLIKGLIKGNNLEEAAELGAKIAALNVAATGAQNYDLL